MVSNYIQLGHLLCTNLVNDHISNQGLVLCLLLYLTKLTQEAFCKKTQPGLTSTPLPPLSASPHLNLRGLVFNFKFKVSVALFFLLRIFFTSDKVFYRYRLNEVHAQRCRVLPLPSSFPVRNSEKTKNLFEKVTRDFKFWYNLKKC